MKTNSQNTEQNYEIKEQNHKISGKIGKKKCKNIVKPVNINNLRYSFFFLMKKLTYDEYLITWSVLPAQLGITKQTLMKYFMIEANSESIRGINGRTTDIPTSIFFKLCGYFKLTDINKAINIPFESIDPRVIYQNKIEAEIITNLTK